MQWTTCWLYVTPVCEPKKKYQTPSLSEVSRNVILTAIHWTKRVDPDSRQTRTALPAAMWNCRNGCELPYKIISLCLRWISLNYNWILCVHQVLLWIVVWNETKSITSLHQCHSYNLKVLLKIKKQIFSKYVVCVLWSRMRVSGWLCWWVAVGVSPFQLLRVLQHQYVHYATWGHANAIPSISCKNNMAHARVLEFGREASDFL